MRLRLNPIYLRIHRQIELDVKRVVVEAPHPEPVRLQAQLVLIQLDLRVLQQREIDSVLSEGSRNEQYRVRQQHLDGRLRDNSCHTNADLTAGI